MYISGKPLPEEILKEKLRRKINARKYKQYYKKHADEPRLGNSFSGIQVSQNIFFNINSIKIKTNKKC